MNYTKTRASQSGKAAASETRSHSLDSASLAHLGPVDVPLSVRGDFQHPLPAVDHLSVISEAVATQVVVGSLDIFDEARNCFLIFL
jgi:hypothetical protein